MTARTCLRGFTLVEMAVVLVLIGLLAGGLLMPLSAEIDRRNMREAHDQIEEIKLALIGYALATGRLPCPADPALSPTEAGAGEALADCALKPDGIVPWATLGVRETDPWGRHYSYRVTPIFADSLSSASFGCAPDAAPAAASFALCSVGDMTLQSTTGGSIAVGVPAVIVAHGKNGAGAYLPGGGRLGFSANPAEKKNSDASTTFVYDTVNAEYDDQVGWISGVILLNRMVAAGKLP